MTHSTWQTPPDCCAGDNCAAEQKQSNSVSAQSRVDVFHSRSNTPNAAAEPMGDLTQQRANPE
jgi:hypothetical protein